MQGRHGVCRRFPAATFAALLLLLSSAVQAARLALVIGNDAYQHVASLNNAGNDARLFATTLREAGFELVGGVQLNLDRNGMWSAVDRVKARLHAGDDLVFYYAGHGVQIESNGVLLPIDIEDDNADQVQRDGVSLYALQEAFKAAHFSLFVVDACRNNPFPSKLGHRGLSDSRGLLPVEPAEGSAIILSASRGQTALDEVPKITKNNGLFTYDLVQAIRSPGIDVVTALRQVRDQVEDQAKLVNHDQRPALVEEMRGSFFLFPASAKSAVAPVSAQPTPAALLPAPTQTEPAKSAARVLSASTGENISVQVVGQCGRDALNAEAVRRAIVANSRAPIPAVIVKVYGGTDPNLTEGSGTGVRAFGAYTLCPARNAGGCPDPTPHCERACRVSAGSSVGVNRDLAVDHLGEDISSKLSSSNLNSQNSIEGYVCGS